MKNEIKSEKCTRYLCAFLDENIYFKEHINNKKERPHSYAKTSEDQMKSKVFNGRNNWYFSLSLSLGCISHLDYRNVVLSGITQGEQK